MWCVWKREMLHVPRKHESLMEELEGCVKCINRQIDSKAGGPKNCRR